MLGNMKRCIAVIFCFLSPLIASAENVASTPDPTHFIAPYFGWIIDGTFLLIFGFFGQILFFARMFLQFVVSARKGESIVPPEFWYLSQLGGMILFLYFFIRSDPVGFSLQALMIAIYMRNIYLIHRQQIPQKLRRRLAKVIVAGFSITMLLFIFALWAEGSRVTENVADPDFFILPLTDRNISANWVVSWGFLGAIIFSGRFVVQWLHSERAKSSVIPVSFWWMALSGSLVLLTYFILRSDPVGVLGQATGAPIYIYNLYLIHLKKN